MIVTSKNIQILLVLLSIGVGYIYAHMLVNSFYVKTYFGSCPSYFPHPFWAWGTVFVSAVISIVLVNILKLNHNITVAFISANLWIVFLALIMIYKSVFFIGYSLSLIDALAYTCSAKETIIFYVTFLTGIILRIK